MSSPTDALAAAMRDIMAENGLTRLDIGALLNRVTATVWFDAFEPVIGCTVGYGATCDDAIEAALASKAAELSAPMADAA